MTALITGSLPVQSKKRNKMPFKTTLLLQKIYRPRWPGNTKKN